MARAEVPSSRKHLGRVLMIWAGSVVLAGTILVVYFQMPLLPLVWAGGITLGITVARQALVRK